ncbi:curli assembly protein CsgF, partial [Sphingomonas solaris]
MLFAYSRACSLRASLKPFGFVAIMVACAAITSPALAEIVYQPVNPSFGGNPFNSSHLLGIANAQNDYKDPASTA